MYIKKSEKVQLNTDYSKLLKKEYVNSKKVFLIDLSKGPLRP